MKYFNLFLLVLLAFLIWPAVRSEKGRLRAFLNRLGLAGQAGLLDHLVEARYGYHHCGRCGLDRADPLAAHFRLREIATIVFRTLHPKKRRRIFTRDGQSRYKAADATLAGP